MIFKKICLILDGFKYLSCTCSHESSQILRCQSFPSHPSPLGKKILQIHLSYFVTKVENWQYWILAE